MNRLSSAAARGFTLVEVMVVVIIIGALSTIAIPSFMTYMRRSRTVEASGNIRKMYDASVAYFQSEHANVGQKIVARQFPDTTGAAPAANACCGQPGDKCDPALAAPKFKTSTWRSLNFSVDDPFYYWYQYDSAGVDQQANFSAWAMGNLDCDAVFSTFLRAGRVDATGGVTGGGGMYTKSETE